LQQAIKDRVNSNVSTYCDKVETERGWSHDARIVCDEYTRADARRMIDGRPVLGGR
jgi:hypothetical protein